MKEVTAYECGFCGKLFLKRGEALSHEGKHYGLSSWEMEKWVELIDATHCCDGIIANGLGVMKFYEALDALYKFETSRGLRSRPMPAGITREYDWMTPDNVL